MKQVIHGDCLEVMPTLPAQSVDMILCDLPYGTTACAWDVIIPFDALWEQYERLIKPGGAVVLTASQPFTSALVMSKPEWFRYSWVWQKPQGTNPMQAARRPLKSHEDVLVFGAKEPAYFPQMEQGMPYSGYEARHGQTIGEAYNSLKSWHRPNAGTRHPKTVLRFSQERGLHPTQKPVPLFEYLIRTYTQPGAVVLDNCAGSGTTGVAAIQCGRVPILIEKDPAYHAIAEKRVANAQPALLGAS